VQNVYNHPVDDLCLAISLRMESCGLGELGVRHRPEAGPKCTKEPTVPIWDDTLWDPKVYPHSFKEEFSSGFCCDILLASYDNGHLRESVVDHKNKVIFILSKRKARHVIHRDRFPRSTGGRKRSIEALLLDGRFGNRTSSVELDVLPDILSKV
jgi:hypothetical protein